MFEKKKRRIDVELEKLDDKIAKYEKILEEYQIYLYEHPNETDKNGYKVAAQMAESYQRLLSTCYEQRTLLINGESSANAEFKSALIGEAVRGATRGVIDLGFISIGQKISDNGGLPLFGSESDITTRFLRRK